MSTLKTTNIAHPSSASNNIVLDSSGNVVLQAGTAAAPALQPTGDTNTGVLFPAADTVAISTGGSERSRVDSSGRLLVGTSTARDKFFNAASGENPLVQFEGAGVTAQGLYMLSLTANNTSSSSGAGASLILARSGGTSVGSYTTVSDGQSLGRISFQGADGSELVEGASITASADGGVGANDLPTRLVFSTTADGASSPTERMRITNNGLLKVTTGTQHSRYTNGIDHAIVQDNNNWLLACVNTYNSGPNGILITFSGQDPNNTSNRFLYCEGIATLRAEIRSNGGLANFQANNVNLSDRNTKKDISPAADTWDCIKEWEIVNYRYKDQADDADLNLGVIAQQVAESCPEVITVFEEAKDDQPEKLGVKEQQMYWMAIKALQEAQVRIEQLETEKAEQQTVLDDLLARVTALEAA